MSVKAILKDAGFTNIVQKAHTLQGTVYKALNKSTNQHVVIKVTNKDLHKNGIAIVENEKHKVNENIIMESSILKYLTADRKNIPKSIIKFYNFYQCNVNFYLIMEDGGSDLFDFIKKAHRLISMDIIHMNEWHKTAKIIFKQMIECIEFIHSKNICHFDISLENFLINDVKVHCHENITSKQSNINFECSDIQIKLIDFGLADVFKTNSNFISGKFCGKMPYKSPEIISNKEFDARSNDIWGLGVCLFMMIAGCAPWIKAHKSDQLFVLIMNGHIKDVLKSWNKLEYVNDDLINMFELFFQYENKRVSFENIKNHSWLKD